MTGLRCLTALVICAMAASCSPKPRTLYAAPGAGDLLLERQSQLAMDRIEDFGAICLANRAEPAAAVATAMARGFQFGPDGRVAIRRTKMIEFGARGATAPGSRKEFADETTLEITPGRACTVSFGHIKVEPLDLDAFEAVIAAQTGGVELEQDVDGVRRYRGGDGTAIVSEAKPHVLASGNVLSALTDVAFRLDLQASK